MWMRKRSGLTALLLVVAVSGADGQMRNSKVLQGVKRVTCAFSIITTGTWDTTGVAKADVKPIAVKVSFHTIDTEDGTAIVNGQFGPLPIITKLSIWSLHFLQMGSEGSLRLTTVFDTETRPGKYKAVHSIHEYTPVILPGFTSRPEQYVGECELER
jgi:hypothetical protein